MRPRALSAGVLKVPFRQRVNQVTESIELPRCRTLEEIEAAARVIVEPKGWVVVRGSDEVRVHKRTSDGAVEKMASFLIEFCDTVADERTYWNHRTGQYEEVIAIRKSYEPWLVSGQRFASSMKAAEAFLKQLQ